MQNNTKIYLVVGSSIIFSAIIFYFNLFFSSPKSISENILTKTSVILDYQSIESIIPGLCTKSSNQGCVLPKIFENAVNSQEISACNFENSDLAKECLNKQIILTAIKNESIDICLDLNENEKNICLNQYYYNMALKKQDKSFCDYISIDEDINICLTSLK